MGYTKLFTEIIMSTVWREENHVRLLWITMLALKDRWHVVNASIPGLADSARITLKECKDAIKILSEPDEYSRTTDFEGRRIEPCDGGWVILNGEKYRNKMSLDERREYQRIKQQEYRDRKKVVKSSLQSSQQFTHTEAETKEETLKDISSSPKTPPVPYQKIIDLYHEKLPSLPKVAKLTSKRKTQIRQRWAEDLPALKNWEHFFEYVSKSEFLMGKKEAFNGRPVFRADIEWITNQTNFTKIAEEKYHV